MNKRTSREKIAQESTAYIDLRIGLNLLGENGRMLLAQYIVAKSRIKGTVPAA